MLIVVLTLCVSRFYLFGKEWTALLADFLWMNFSLKQILALINTDIFPQVSANCFTIFSWIQIKIPWSNTHFRENFDHICQLTQVKQ